MSGKQRDPLSDAIHAAVQAAVAEHMAPFLKELRKVAFAEAQAPAGKGEERFVSMVELCKRLGVNRSTILRRERVGKLPKRRTFPDGRVGWTASDIDRWFASATEGTDPERNAELAARIHH